MSQTNKRNIKKIDNLDEKIKLLEEKDYSVLEDAHNFSANGAIGGFRAAIDKMKYNIRMQILTGILAGFICGLGYGACLFVVKDLPESVKWVKPVILALIFPFCIVMVTFVGGGLFTSHTVATLPVFKRMVSPGRYLKNLGAVYFGNFLGTGIVVLLLMMTGVFKKQETIDPNSFMWAVYDMGIHKMAVTANNLDPTAAVQNALTINTKNIVLGFISGIGAGILCNVLVSATLPITSSTKNHAASLIVMFSAVGFFVLSGYQHSPANTFFFWTFLFEGVFNTFNGHFSESGYLLAVWFILLNLLPTAIGNWIGGGLLFSIIYYFINRKYVDLLFDKINLEKYLEIKKSMDPKLANAKPVLKPVLKPVSKTTVKK